MNKDFIDPKKLRDAWLYLEQYSTELGPEMLTYFNDHRTRYEKLVGVVGECCGSLQENDRVRLLDIGLAHQTLLFDRIWPDYEVNTLGWHDDRFALGKHRKHIEFELNDSYYPEKWPKVSEGYNIIVMAEVIEHLHTAPVQILRCLRSLLAPNGFLIVTTPNAVALQQRLRLLLGRNPFEMIRETRTNPGHFREYTGPELSKTGEDAGLKNRSDCRRPLLLHAISKQSNSPCGHAVTARQPWKRADCGLQTCQLTEILWRQSHAILIGLQYFTNTHQDRR